MSSPYADQVRALFDRLAELDPAAREAALRGADAHPSVIDEVLGLLEADEQSHRLLDAAPEELAAALGEGASEPLTEIVGQMVGPYRVQSLLGRGGMGAVFLAVREDVGLEVALKLVRGALGDPDRIARFRREERFLARLSHPKISRLLDVGVASDGTPWLAMEHVRGKTITRWCDEEGLDVRDRLKLFTELCDAVAFAHRHLIVHRDLKPSNVMVTEEGTVKLLDFGVAKLLDDDAPEEGLTVTGVRILSPEYAAPEQVLGHPVSTATDVHALGIILYELLTGARPWQASGTNPAELAASVLAADVGRPSAAMVARSASVEDLDAICLKALSREPGARYASVERLRNDVLRHLDGLPVQARLPTLRYRAGKFVRRHRAGVAVAAMIGALLLIGVGGVAWQVNQTRSALEQTRQLSTFFLDVFQSNDPAETRGRDAPMKGYLDLAQVHIDALDDRPVLQARVLALMSRGYVGLGEYGLAEGLATDALGRQRGLAGDHDVEIAVSLEAMGSARFERGDLAGATEALTESLALRRRALGNRAPETTRTMLLLAEVMRNQGRYGPAEDLAREALARRLTDPAQLDDPVAEAITGVATVLWHQGGNEPEAQRLFRSALVIREELYGPDDFRVDPSLTALGDFLVGNEGGSEAEELARRSLELRRSLYGDDDPRVIAALNRLAAAILAQGRTADARAIYADVVERYQRAPAVDRPMLAVAIENVSDTYERDSRLDSAEVHLTSALGMRMRLDDVAGVARLRHALGLLQRERGRLSEAEASLREAYRLRSESLGEGHPETMLSGAALGGVLTEGGALGEAEALLRGVLAKQELMLGEPHPDLTRSLVFLGTLLTARGSWDEALAVHTRALRLARRTLATSDPLRREAAHALSDHHRARGQPGEAERILREEEGVADTSGRPGN